MSGKRVRTCNYALQKIKKRQKYFLFTEYKTLTDTEKYWEHEVGVPIFD